MTIEERDEGEGEYSLKCPHCDKGFTRAYILREHIRAQHGDKASKHCCPKCGACFVLKSQLDKHLAFHSPTSQICKICHKTFANVYRLQRHMISHDESNDLRKFKCPECGKAFKFKHHLKEHIRIHSGEKPFECTNCGKRFSHSGSYSSHMTSKKCWVVNMKMRKPETKQLEPPQEDVLRPLVPRVAENGLDMGLSSFYANQYPHQFIPFDPTGGHLPPHIMAAHLNGLRPPMLPFPPFTAGHMFRPMIPGNTTSAYGFPNNNCKKDLPSPASKKLIMSPDARDDNIPRDDSKVPSEEQSSEDSKPVPKIDENQNTPSIPNSHDVVIGENGDACQENEDDKDSVDGSEINDNENQDAEYAKETDDSEDVSKESSNAKIVDLDAVKKVLEIVDATVNEQQKHKDDKTSISKLASSEEGGAASTESPEEDATVRKGPEVKLPCRYCKEVFKSPVDLHQHERYLCKLNTEIRRRESTDSGVAASLQSPVSQDGSKMSDEEGDAASDDSFLDKDGHQYRVRSLITDDQLHVLKSHYQLNPRPNKYELMQIGNTIGFPKRVVQVWFQNMRARDRRRGRQPAPFAPPASTPSSSTNDKMSDSVPKLSSSPYIPVVPQVAFNGLVPSPPTHNMVFYQSSKINGQLSTPTPSSGIPRSQQLEPLDLSTRRNTTEAHSHKPFSHLPSPQPSDGEVLNLSKKSIKSEEHNGQFEESAIFKYMQQEGMILPEVKKERSLSNRSTPQPLLVSPGSRSHTPAPPAAHSRQNTPEPGRPIPHPGPGLLMTSTPIRRSPSLPPPGSPTGSELMSQPSSLDSSFNSTHSIDSAVHDLTPGSKNKRARKKSWRQMEMEEAQMDLEDALMIDEDSQSRKKRKSWKAHRVDGEDGLYSCDQCDKMFSKQSSLARHKYEHSGQRPFNCDDCGKAFKHKHHLTEHRRLHSGEKPFECRKCGKRFSHSGSFSQHMNHRYKYCKPLRFGDRSGSEEEEEQ